MASLSLLEELLQKPHRDILNVLVLDYLQKRTYLSPQSSGVDDRGAEDSEDSEYVPAHYLLSTHGRH